MFSITRASIRQSSLNVINKSERRARAQMPSTALGNETDFGTSHFKRDTDCKSVQKQHSGFSCIRLLELNLFQQLKFGTRLSSLWDLAADQQHHDGHEAIALTKLFLLLGTENDFNASGPKRACVCAFCAQSCGG